VPAALDGRSLLPLIAGSEPASAARPVFAELGRDHPMKMVRAGDHKLIHDVVTPERRALFDLRADPGERTDVSAAHADRAAQLTQVLREGVGLSAGAERATSSHPLSDREIQALKSMGYVQ
jgi:arylsulfatase A-like enzyme